MKYFYLFFICCIANCFSSFAQDTLITVDGYKYPIRSYSIDLEYSELKFQNIKGRNKTIDLDNAFSIRSGSNETFVYPFDPYVAQDVAVYDLRQYISGSQLAVEKYKGCAFFYTGLAIGVASCVGLRLCEQDEAYGLFVSGAYVAGVNFIFPTKNLYKKFNIADDNMLQRKGFSESANRVCFRKSLIGSGIGVLAGLITAGFMD